MSQPTTKTHKKAKPNKPQKCYACGKRGHYRKGCEEKTSHLKIGNPEPQEPSLTQLLAQETSNPRTMTQQPPRIEPIYEKPIKGVNISDLQRETKETRNEIRTLKQNLQIRQKTHSLKSTSYQSNEESPSDNGVQQPTNPRVETIKEPSRDLFLDTITKTVLHKWHSKVRIVISKDFEFEVIALIDSGADLNCIQEGIIPSKYFKKSRERLTSASGGKMQIESKLPKAHVCQDNMCFKTTFVLVKNLTDKVILGNPFLCSLYPFTVDSKGITTQPFGQTIRFRFIGEPVPRNISTIQANTVSKTVNLISAKTTHIKYLQEEIRYKKVEDQLACKTLQEEIRKFEEKLKQEVCSDLPTAFWHRKRHEVALPYVKDFNEKDIPTKA